MRFLRLIRIIPDERAVAEIVAFIKGVRCALNRRRQMSRNPVRPQAFRGCDAIVNRNKLILAAEYERDRDSKLPAV